MQKIKHKSLSHWLYVFFTIVMYLIPAVVFLLWLSFVGSANLVVDLGSLLIGYLLGGCVWHLLKYHIARIVTSVLVAVFVTWILISVSDLVFPPSKLSLNPGRFLNLRTTSPWKKLRVGIALSGGGIRAALLHAGVLDQLEYFKVPISVISAVSGGSIIGAFYAAGGSPSDFLRAVSEHKFLLIRESTKLQNLSRLKQSFLTDNHYKFSRAQIVTNFFDSLIFDKATFSSLYLEPKQPELLLCTTDVTYGRAIGITRYGVVLRPISQTYDKHKFDNTSNRQLRFSASRFIYSQTQDFPSSSSISTLVTASGAFPMIINPVLVELRLPEDEYHDARIDYPLLSDGGLLDNSGLNLLLDADFLASKNKAPSTLKVDIAIASDAEKSFSPSYSDGSQWDLINRYIDVFHTNAGTRRQDDHNRIPTWLLHRNSLQSLGLNTILDVTDFWTGQKSSTNEREGSPTDFNPFPFSDIQLEELIKGIEHLQLTEYSKKMLIKIIKEQNSSGSGLPWRLILAEARFELDALSQIFSKILTLDPNLSEEDAQKIYALGQAMVIAEWPRLSKRLHTLVN